MTPTLNTSAAGHAVQFKSTHALPPVSEFEEGDPADLVAEGIADPIQAHCGGDVWAVFVCCVVLNRTYRRTDVPVLRELFNRWPTYRDLADAKEDEVAAVLQPTGLQYWKARLLIAAAGSAEEGEDLDKFPGFAPYARYARDALATFCGDGPVMPSGDDPVICAYLEREGRLR